MNDSELKIEPPLTNKKYTSILKSKIFWLLFSIFLIFIIIGASLYLYVFYISPSDTFPTNTVITIEKGSSLKKVARQFEEAHLVRSSLAFETVGWLLKKEKKIKAGEYFFEKRLNAIDLMKEITGNGFQNELVKITIPEGFTLRDIGFLFENMGMWQAEELWEITGLPAVDCRNSVCPDYQGDFIEPETLIALKPSYISMEGYLFPDTYYVPINITPGAMVKIILDNFEKKITPELRRAMNENGYSFFQIMTMASLIEKEAYLEQDRKLISGILWKRLKEEMPLQVDAVFPYIIDKNSYQLTVDDLKVDSLYNTYLYKGLPLGPIANPGLESIKAALYPADSPFWYYLSDKSGNTYYSVTYDEHLLKKEKYLK